MISLTKLKICKNQSGYASHTARPVFLHIFNFFATRNEKSCIFASVIKAPPFFREWTWPSEDGLFFIMPNGVTNGVKSYYKPEKWK